MTQKEAKELSLELWTYLAKHPECYKKSQVPDELYFKIKDLYNECPLCELFVDRCCKFCPLKTANCDCYRIDSPWAEWFGSQIKETDRRKQAAERIVQIISAWEPGESEK